MGKDDGCACLEVKAIYIIKKVPWKVWPEFERLEMHVLRLLTGLSPAIVYLDLLFRH